MAYGTNCYYDTDIEKRQVKEMEERFKRYDNEINNIFWCLENFGKYPEYNHITFEFYKKLKERMEKYEKGAE